MFVKPASILCSLLLAASATPIAKVEERQSIPVGSPIFSCNRPGVVALTFDDGPFAYTDQVLNSLAAAGLKATFFLNGENWGNIASYAGTVRRMINEGHQVGSHTWSHPDLATLNAAAVTSQMTRLEDALLTIIGKFPTYMRPPYFSYNSGTLQTLGSLGYKVIHADIDTLDWQYNTPSTTETSAIRFQNGVNAGGSIALAHDVHQTTASTLVNRMIQIVQQKGLRAVTVGDCLGDAAANWYRTSRTGTPPPTDPPPTGNPSPDGTCGGSNRYICQSGLCCSQYGWCGATAEYCSAGCQSAFGVCR